MTTGVISWEGVVRLVEDKLAEYEPSVQATARKILLERIQLRVGEGRFE